MHIWVKNYYLAIYKYIIFTWIQTITKYLFYIICSTVPRSSKQTNRYDLPEPVSILAWRRAAHSSIFNFGIPEATASAMPPISSIYTIKQQKQNLV